MILKLGIDVSLGYCSRGRLDISLQHLCIAIFNSGVVSVLLNGTEGLAFIIVAIATSTGQGIFGTLQMYILGHV